MTHSKGAGDYTVGYGKPPVEHQFKPKHTKSKGPRKPKAQGPSLEQMITSAFLEEMPITINGKPKKMAKVEVILKQTVQKALAGDNKSIMTVVKLAQAHLPSLPDPEGTEEELSAAELAIMKDVNAAKALFEGESGSE